MGSNERTNEALQNVIIRYEYVPAANQLIVTAGKVNDHASICVVYILGLVAMVVDRPLVSLHPCVGCKRVQSSCRF